MSTYTADIVSTLTFGQDAPVDRFTFCPRGEKLAVRLASGAIALVDIRTSEMVKFESRRSILEIVGIAFTPDGKYFVCAHGDYKAAIFDVERPGPPVHVIPCEDFLRDVAVTRDGKTILTSAGAIISAWDMQTGALNRRYTGPSDIGFFIGPRFSRILPVDDAGNRVVAMSVEGSIWMFEAAEGIARSGEFEGRVIHRAVAGDAHCLCMTPDKKHFITNSMDKHITFWKADSGERTRSVKTLGHVSSISFMPDWETLLMHARERDDALARRTVWTQVAVHEHGEPTILIASKESDDVAEMAASLDGTLVATAGEKRGMSIWRVSGRAK
jgi:WD40 repeat protein